MSSGDAIQLLVLFLLIIGSGFFSSAETALTTVNRIRIQTLCDEGDKRAAVVLKITENPSKMLSTILIGNNLVNNFSAALATALAIRFMGDGMVGVVTGILTIVILIFGEITPKTLAAANSEKMALAYASVILFLMKLLTPVIFVINLICRFLLKILHVDMDNPNSITEEELRTIVDVSQKEGVIEKEERQMIYNVVDFGDSEAKDVMVPRADMVTISVNASYEEILKVFQAEKYTRLPVYQDYRDNIIGILNIKDFFFSNQDHFDVRSIMYKPYFTYEVKKTSELLIEMQNKIIPIAIVIDEYGSAVGMVSIEDLLEEIVGEIRDEYDEDEKDLIQKLSEKEYLIEGALKLDDLNDALSLSLDSEDYDTIGGFIIEHLDQLPSEGDSIITEAGLKLLVEKMDKNRVESVRLTLPEETEPESSADDEN